MIIYLVFHFIGFLLFLLARTITGKDITVGCIISWLIFAPFAYLILAFFFIVMGSQITIVKKKDK